jgi:ADP-heptose:LPS heptosyltransferase
MFNRILTRKDPLKNILNRYGFIKNLTLFDVGAHKGQTAMYLLKIFPQSKVYSFEPNPELFEELTDRIKYRRDIKCITPHPELIRLDPHIESINKNETFYSFDSTYWELIVRKEKSQNIIEHNMLRLGIDKYDYKAAYYLSEEEKDWAKQETNQFEKPILAICTKSKEPVKNWPKANWAELIQNLKVNFSIIQLGDEKEPIFEGVHRYAGKLSMRESGAILSKATYFIGPDSLLMHISNGLDIPSTIIFGGSRPVKCFGYSENINLKNTPDCSPCWIHDGYEQCKFDLLCIKSISVNRVLNEIRGLITIK